MNLYPDYKLESLRVALALATPPGYSDLIDLRWDLCISITSFPVDSNMPPGLRNTPLKLYCLGSFNAMVQISNKTPLATVAN